MQRDIQELRTAVQQRDALIAELNARMQQDGQGDMSHAGDAAVAALLSCHVPACWRWLLRAGGGVMMCACAAGNLAERERALVAQTEQLQLVSQHQFEMQAQLAAVQKALQEQQARAAALTHGGAYAHVRAHAHTRTHGLFFACA